MAALIAKDESHLTNLHYLDRGYESLDDKLLSLGANLERKKDALESLNFLSEQKHCEVLI